MKNILTPKLRLSRLTILFVALAFACNDKERIDEVPDNIVPSKPCPTLYTNIMSMFGEHRDNEIKHTQLFTDTIEKKIVLSKESELYIAFISEGAGYKNSLGYYTYTEGSVPSSSSGIKKEILFPNVSDRVLAQGDMVQVGTGKFPAGTVIGFFIIVQGWQNGTIDYDKPTYYTDYAWNSDGKQQHILFRENECTDIVMAFEDTTEAEGSDRDYNDIIFTVSDNNQQLQVTAIDIKNVADI